MAITKRFVGVALTALAVAGPAAANKGMVICTDPAGSVWGVLSYDAVNDPNNVTVILNKPVPITSIGQDWQGKRPEELDIIKGFLPVHPQGHLEQLFHFHVGPRARALEVDFEGQNGKILNTITCAIPRP